MTFSTLSKVANVVLHDFGPKGIGFAFHAKSRADAEAARRRARPKRRAFSKRAR